MKLRVLGLIIIIIIIFFIGLAAILSAVSINQINSFSETDYQIKFNPFGISFYSPDLSTEIVKISPLDDFYYSKDTKDHLVSSSSFVGGAEDNNPLANILRTLMLGRKSLVWKAKSKEGIIITYEILKESNSLVRFKRKMNKTNIDVSAIGQSLVLCKDCLITDQMKRAFFTPKEVSSDKFKLAQSFQLTPVIVTNNILPDSISKLIILDSNFNTRLVIFIRPSQQIFYDDRWNLVELKTPLKNEVIEVIQTLSFKNVD